MPAKPKHLLLFAAAATALALAVWLLSTQARPPARNAPSGDAPARGSTPPPALFAAFTAGGPIVTGDVIRVDRDTDASAVDAALSGGTVILAVDEILRGGELPESLELPFRRRPPSPRWPAGPWDRVIPELGKRVLAILSPELGSRASRCVLDLDGADQELLPLIRRMLELDALSGPERRARLLASADDPSPMLRALAVELLVYREPDTSPATRSELLGTLSRSAQDKTRPLQDRLQALSLAGLKVYDGFSAEDPVNDAVLSLLASLLTDHEPRVRGEAATILHGYLLGAGTRRPSVARIAIADEAGTRAQLARDVESRSAFAAAADGLLQLFEKEREGP